MFIYNMSNLSKNLLLRALLSLIGLLIVLFCIRSNTFVGNLEQYSDFKVIDSNDNYDLLRVVDSDNKTSRLALYTEEDYAFEFLYEGDLVLRLEDELIDGDYYLFDLSINDLSEVEMHVLSNGNTIDLLVFAYTNTWESANVLMYDYNDFDALILQDNIGSNSMLIDIISSEDTSIGYVILLFLIVLIIIFFPYGYLYYKIKLPRLKRVLILVVIDIISAAVLFGITIFIMFLIFNENEDAMSEYDIYEDIVVENDDFELRTNIGLTRTFWFSGSNLEVTYHIILLSKDETKQYISNIVLDNSIEKGDISVPITQYNVDNLKDIFPNDDDMESENYKITVREAKTGRILYETEEHKFYADTEEVISELNLSSDYQGTIIAISVFLFYSIIVVPGLLVFAYKKTKDNPNITFWMD